MTLLRFFVTVVCLIRKKIRVCFIIFLKISVVFSPRKDQILQNNKKGGELLVYAEMKKEMGTAVLSKEDALELMMSHYGESILRLVYLLVKDRSMAEDITQSIFSVNHCCSPASPSVAFLKFSDNPFIGGSRISGERTRSGDIFWLH